jgi:hypothetical protein
VSGTPFNARECRDSWKTSGIPGLILKMKHIIKAGALIFFFLAMLLAVSATTPTQQFNKIYLTPYYISAMTLGINYTFNITVNPPDKISKVINAIIGFNGQINGQTQSFTLWVNNQSCNTPTYSVATAFSTTGNVQFSFDCSNIINKAGDYKVTMKSAVNTGAMSGWLELTYMNNPPGTSTVFGTEYVEGDDATIFLLLKDADGIPVTNGTCSIDIYYPNIANLTHPIWISNGLMMYKSNGLYYYDFTVPYTSGLYMVNARCSYMTNNNIYYTLDFGTGPLRTVIAGTYTGDTLVFDDYSEWLYTECDSSGGSPKTCEASYQWSGLNPNLSRLDLQYLGENTLAATLNFSYWNWTSSAWVPLPNSLVYKATAAGGVPSGIDEYVANNIPISNHSVRNNTVRIKMLTTAGSTFKQYDNWLVLRTSELTSSVQDIKGSGEVHVSSAPAGDNRFIKILSCNGFTDGRCGTFTNDGEFDMREGEIEDYFNFSATSSRANVPISFESTFTVDCTALYWIKKFNGTAWVNFTSYSTYSDLSAENCIITLRENITSGTVYSYWIKYDNFMKWEVDWVKKISDTLNFSIAPLCDYRNFTYVVPITDSTADTNDTITDFCYQFKDDQYWINTYYEDSQSITNAGDYASYVQEMRFYRNALYDRYLFLNAMNVSSANMQGLLIQILSGVNEINATTHNISNYLQNTIYPAVDSLEASMTNVLANQTTMYGKLLDIQANITTSYQDLQVIKLYLLSINSTMVTEVNQNEAKLDIINNTINLIYAQNINTTTHISQIQGNISLMQTKLDNIYAGLSNISIGNLSVAVNLTDVLSGLNVINQSIISMRSNVTGEFSLVKSESQNIHDEVERIEWKLDCNNTINIVCDRLTDLKNSIISVNNSVNAISFNSSMLQAIYTLSQQTNLTVNGIQTYLSGTIYPAVDSLEGGLQNISQNLTSISVRIDQMNASIANLYPQFSILQAMLQNVNSTMQTNISTVLTRLELMNVTIEYINTNVLNVQSQLTALQGNMTLMQADINNIYLAVDTLEPGQQSILGNLSQIWQDVLYTQSSLTSVNNSLQVRLDNVDASLIGLHGKVDAVEWKLDCNNTINIMCDYLATLDLHIQSTNSTVNNMQQYLTQNVTPQLTAIETAISSMNLSVSGIQSYMQNTLFPLINATDYKTDLLLVNTTNIWDGIVELKSNFTTQAIQLDYLEFLLDSINQTIIANNSQLLFEINQNEAKIDQLNLTLNLVYAEILNTVGPQLVSIQNNLSSMQGQLINIQYSLDYQNATQQEILGNLSNIYQAISSISLNTSGLEADLFALNASIQGRFDSTDLQLASIQTEVNHIEWKLDCNNTINIMCDKLDTIYNLSLEINQTSANISAYLYGPITLYLNNINSTVTYTYTTLLQMNQTLYQIYYLLFGINSTNPPDITVSSPGSLIWRYSPYFTVNASINSTSGYLLNYSETFLYLGNSLIWSNSTGYIGSLDYQLEESVFSYNLAPGIYTLIITARDMDGRYSYITQPLQIYNNPPTISLLSPDGGMYANNVTITYADIKDADADDLTVYIEQSPDQSSWSSIAQRQYPLYVNETCPLSIPAVQEGNFTPNESIQLNRLQLVLNETGTYAITLYDTGIPTFTSNLTYCQQNTICDFRFSNAALSASTYTWNLTGNLAGGYACNTSHPWLVGPSSIWQRILYTPNNASVIWNLSPVQPWLYYYIRVRVTDGLDSNSDVINNQLRVLGTGNNGSTTSTSNSGYMYCNLETNECFTKDQIEGKTLGAPSGTVFGILPAEQAESIKTMVLNASSSLGLPWWLFLIIIGILGVLIFGLWRRKNQTTYAYP